MASSESSISTLLRPRYISAAVIAVAAVTTIGLGIWHDHWRRVGLDDEIRRPSGTLHRSNAVRRGRRASQAQQQNDSTDNPPPTSTAEATGNHVVDENAPEPAETVIDDPEADANWLDNAPHRAGQNIVSLLFRVSEDNARRSSYVHRGCACNACGAVPIRGIRYRCANCADFDLCETCESQGLHIKTHIFYKVKVPAPPFGPRQMQPVWYPGDPDTRVRNLNKSLINRLARQTGFERQELEALWEQWTYMANTEWRDDPDELFLAMDRKTFERCLVPSGGYRHTSPNLIHDRMFAFYDTNNDGLIGFSEFLEGLSYRKRKDKLRRIFDGYDTDGDGFVSRRDFLRFFRAYYVLYKQMQKDILEGLDDQVMSSIETQQLVNGRQPLSSMFGREGRVPSAVLQRTMPGKVINNQTGETIVEDRPNGIVAEDGTDTSTREDLLARLFTRWSRYLTPSGMYQDHYVPVVQDDMVDTLNDSLAAANYYDALLNPPTRVQDLPELLIGQVDPTILAGIDEDIFMPNADTYGAIPIVDVDADGDADGEGLVWESASQRPHAFQDTSRSASGTASPEDAPEAEGSGAGETNGHAASQSSSNTANAAATGGTGFSVLDGDLADHYRSSPNVHPRSHPNHPPTPGQVRAEFEAETQNRKLRASKTAARRKLHHRWVRRNFYLDEEEGAMAPSQWTDDKDIIADVHVSDAAGEPSSSAAAAASRVRFNTDTEGAAADDYDKYEGQPSPSSSARTVLPDTWGADYNRYRYPDLPEAERDAGREILYQVMQQSFNEMLDTLFMNKEDLAIAAAETKEQRAQYRHLFKKINLVKEWEGKTFRNGKLEKVTLSSDSQESQDSQDGPAHTSRSTGVDPNTDPITLNRSLDQMSLEELLNQSGYEIDDSAIEASGIRVAGGASTGDRLAREGAPEPESQRASEAPEAAAVEEAEDTDETDETDEETDEEAETAEQVEATESRDPTLPQFRPDTEAEYEAQLQAQAAGTASNEQKSTPNLSARVEDASLEDASDAKGKDKEAAELEDEVAANEGKEVFSTASAPDISREHLARLKGLDLAEREAHERGGWGKLNYAEFEATFRREETKNNRLDYLGSWIDFCIP